MFALELDVPVIMTLRVSPKVEGRESSIPMISDIKEQGAFENYVDIIKMVYGRVIL